MGKNLGEFEQVVLFSILRLEDDAYGLAIRDSIEDRTGRRVSPGAIYTTLGRLAERGIVSAQVERSRDLPGRRRKYYRLTAAGARQLRDSFEAIRSAADGVTGRLHELSGGEA